MKWIEWNPVPFGSSSGDFLPSSYSFGLSLLTLLLFLPLGLLGYFSPDLSLSIQLLPLYLSLFIFGMPHGGADHLLIWGMIKESSWVFRIGTLLLYPLLSILYLICWHFQPVASAVFFLALTIFHWGQGDRYLSIKLHRAGYLVRSRFLSTLHLLARGSLPILLPGYLGNDTYRAFLEAMVRQAGHPENTDLSWISENPAFFLYVPAILLSVQLLLSFLFKNKGEGRPILIDLCEGVFLFAWFLVVPTIWALGLYFALWHSLRHGLRILWLDNSGRTNLQNRAYLLVKARWLQLTSLMTILALIGLWLILSLPLHFQGIELDWLGKAMLGISILTLPHTVVVCLMDKFQGPI